MRWLLVTLVFACKEPGTITLDLVPADGAACANTDHVLLFAEPNSCEACACGGCFAKAGSIVWCEGCTFSDLHGVSLPLDPGHWAIVVDMYDATDTLVGSECVEIDVGEDGTASRKVDPPVVECLDTCQQP